MKKTIAILFVFISVYSNSQNKHIVKMSQKEAFNIINEYGADSLSSLLVEPIDLVYLNGFNADPIIENEFSNISFKKYLDTTDLMVYPVPGISMEIAEQLYNESAAKLLFEYYKELPKFVKSDTLYSAYVDLDELLSIFVYYNPNGLEKQLLNDFDDWSFLIKKAKLKKHKTKEQLIEEFSKMTYYDRLNSKNVSLELDVRYLAFQIAVALNKLGNTDFSDKRIKELKKSQTHTFIDNYSFPQLYVVHSFEDSEPQFSLELKQDYTNMEQLVENTESFEYILKQRVETCCGSEIFKILYNDNSAYVEFALDNGWETCLVKLRNDMLLIYSIVSIIE